MSVIRRREFITLLGGAAAWPLAVGAQQAAMPVIGFLGGGSPDAFAHVVNAFRQGLYETGFAEGQNVTIEYRWAEGQYDRLPALVADLIRQKSAVIVATGGDVGVRAAKKAATAIPIVFTSGSDPVAAGFVSSLNRPGGNVTGVSLFVSVLEGKKLELLRELVPMAAVIGFLVNPNNPRADVDTADMQAAARALGKLLLILKADGEHDFDAVFTNLAQQRVDALVVHTEPFFLSRRDHLVELAARYSIPTIYGLREFAAAGGLISYGTKLSNSYRQVGIYTGKILKGEKPADLPVMQPTKFEFVINLKAAKALGLTVPTSLLVRADEVIE
jgi:putative tryptophan/tyrosine transport system substrate-binding protein